MAVTNPVPLLGLVELFFFGPQGLTTALDLVALWKDDMVSGDGTRKQISWHLKRDKRANKGCVSLSWWSTSS